MSYSLPNLIELLVAQKGDAVHLYPEEAPILEISRVLHRVDGPPLGHADINAFLESMASKDDLLELKHSRMASFYHHLEDGSMFHVMAFREVAHIRLEIRRFK